MEQDIEELLSALRLTEAMRAIGKEGLEQMVAREATGIEKRIAAAKAKKDGRTAAGKRRSRLNYQKRWMRAKRMKLLEGIPEEGWYAYLMTNRKLWKVSRDEWEQYVEPYLGDGWISIHRYDGKAKYTLDNIYISDGDRIVFDGKEHLLRLSGAIL